MDQWLSDLLAAAAASHSDWGNMAYSTQRRILFLRRWPEGSLRAAEQDARLGKPDDLARYDAEIAAIKIAIPKAEA